MKTSSAFDAMTSPATAVEEDCSQSVLILEKRKHAETEDESPQSQPLPTEKRIRGETEQQPPRVKQDGELISEKEEASFNKLSADDQKSFPAPDGTSVVTLFPDDSEDDEIGDTGSLFHDCDWMNHEDPSDCCCNDFMPLVFKENPTLYDELKTFGKRAVASYNDIYKYGVCFEDIGEVTSCNASCQHHVLCIKVLDPSQKSKVIVIRGKVRGGFLKATVNDFMKLGVY